MPDRQIKSFTVTSQFSLGGCLVSPPNTFQAHACVKKLPASSHAIVLPDKTTMSCSPQGTDIELGRLRDGYPMLAKWIARDPDDDPLIFRKFGRHSARVLLYLQCRLVALEREIDDLDEQARTAKDLETRRSLQRWEKLTENAKRSDSIENELVLKINDFQSYLKEYCRLSTRDTSNNSEVLTKGRRTSCAPVASRTTPSAQTSSHCSLRKFPEWHHVRRY